MSALAIAPSIRVALLFALVGLGFSGGSLLLARALSPSEFGITALWLAVFYVSGALAPWGADGVVNRRHIRPGWHLALRTIFTSAVTGTAAVFVAALLYPFSTPFLLLLQVSVIGGGMSTMAAAQFQARHQFTRAMAIWRGSNLLLVAAGIVAILQPHAGALLPVAVLTAGTLLVAGFGWVNLRDTTRGEPEDASEPFIWREALAYFTAASAAAVLPQIERLVIPRVLSLEDLAVFGVLAAVVIAPFRMVQAGVAYTLFPRLSKAETIGERRRLVGAELRIVLPGLLLAGLAVWYLAPWVTELFVGDKYELDAALLLAGLIAGAAKLAESFGRALVSALGTNRELALYGTASWAALAAAVFGARLGMPWGVPGVIIGTTGGLSIRWLLALGLGLRHLTRERLAASLGQPASLGGPTERESPGPF